MNQLKVHEHFATVPEGTDIGKVGLRTCCLVGLAIGAMTPLPSQQVHSAELRKYFMENSNVLREVAFDINEVVSFNVDRATEYAYRVYQKRYEVAFDCNPYRSFGPIATALGDYSPELESVGIESAAVAKTIECLREGVREKTGENAAV